jgi:hypothetical protein
MPARGHRSKVAEKPKRRKAGEKKNKKGRPKIIDVSKPITDSPVVKKLIEAFRLDSTINEACAYAGISKPAFYDYLGKSPDLAFEIDKAREFLKLQARNAVGIAISENKDVKAAMWYLERKVKNEFSTRQELTGAGGNAVLLAPAVANLEKEYEIYKADLLEVNPDLTEEKILSMFKKNVENRKNIDQ